MKKKLEDAYIPDKGARKEKILIGLSGGLDSYVMAYLLKIQKYELIAATIVNSWDDLESDQKKTFSCHINSATLDGIKDFCHRMNIPLHVIKAPSEFKERVVEGWLADKLVGRFPLPCWSCHQMRMETLHNKMKEVGAKQFATGHYAKIFHQDLHSSVFVHTSNDEKHDQSSLLSRLPHEVLNSLLLPLSDLTKKEVLKLSENFGLHEEEKRIQIHQCLKNTEELIPVLDKKVPPRFHMEGDITDISNTSNYGQHTGIYHFTAGEAMEVKDGGKILKVQMSSYSFADKRVEVAPLEYFERSKFLLVNCKYSEEVNWTEPMKGFVMSQSHPEGNECWVHPKSLSAAYVELISPYFFNDGEIVSVLKKKGKNSKIFLTGEVRFLAQEEVKEEGDESVQKINVTLDF